ncbi:UDP-3-O-acylglucosamine N-acyltransferase-like isoform X2 [Sitodiplosis mosellana]|uniref:UDP-3-O-acylglucosamine N-acyltransferase-like isoform X2 n=1 Tax=Sitodiplosis mosellana TaxID=263140 RepID=UPI002444E082|nr:UDP-3-O-acylglucosamine N-acyltransferase-like isoform X2 [Sitodiplosis mosellana]
MIKFALFLFSLHVATSFLLQNMQVEASIDPSAHIGDFTNIDPTAIIKANARIGDFVSIYRLVTVGENSKVGNFARIDSSVIIKANARIGDYASIDRFTSVAEKSKVGDFVVIAQRCTIANDVTISNFVKFATGTAIGTGSIVHEYVKTRTNVTIRNGVEVNDFASIGNDAEIQDDSFIDEYASIGADVKVASKVYIGQFSSIQANAIIRELAIIHVCVKIPSGATVENNEVVIRSPSTYELYKKCAVISSISDAQIKIAADRSSVPSAPFNAMLRPLIDAQINGVKTKCNHGNMTTKPDLAVIKSLYLIQYYGLERFKEAQPKAHGWNIEVINAVVYVDGFRENSAKNILESDVKKKFIQLLEMEEDSERKNRVKNDTFCSVTAQILNGQRELTVAEPSCQPNVGIINDGGLNPGH